MEEFKYTKKCVGCRKPYQSNARGQRFCTPECGKKYNTRLKTNRQWSDEHKTILRIKARCHSLAVDILKYQYFTEGKDWACSCGETKRLEVHHKDLSWANNNPSNLQLVCHKCHAEVHSAIIAENRQEGYFMSSRYEESFYNFAKEIIKEPTVVLQRLSDRQFLYTVAEGHQVWGPDKKQAMEIGESSPILSNYYNDNYKIIT